MIRHRLALAGPGVLRRSGFANEEDLDTCESVHRVDPFSFVSFVENGKVWWFDFATLWRWSQMSVEPTNPYTKVPLSMETRRRLRRLWSYRRRHREPIPLDSTDTSDRIRVRWTLLCQVFAECGFGVMSPDLFVGITKSEYVLLFRILRDELQASLPGERHAISLVHRCLITAWTLSPSQFRLQSSFALMAMLFHARRPYPIAACILSALYRI